MENLNPYCVYSFHYCYSWATWLFVSPLTRIYIYMYIIYMYIVWAGSWNLAIQDIDRLTHPIPSIEPSPLYLRVLSQNRIASSLFLTSTIVKHNFPLFRRKFYTPQTVMIIPRGCMRAHKYIRRMGGISCCSWICTSVIYTRLRTTRQEKNNLPTHRNP